MNTDRTQKTGQSDVIYRSQSPANKKVDVNKHFQASWTSQSMGCLFFPSCWGSNISQAYSGSSAEALIMDGQPFYLSGPWSLFSWCCNYCQASCHYTAFSHVAKECGYVPRHDGIDSVFGEALYCTCFLSDNTVQLLSRWFIAQSIVGPSKRRGIHSTPKSSWLPIILIHCSQPHNVMLDSSKGSALTATKSQCF